MKLEDVLIKYNFPPQAQEIYKQTGIVELFPPQIKAVEKGVLEGKNLVLSVPTAAGKTLIAELAILKAALAGGRCIYIAPLKALASEKYEDFKKKFSPLGIKVGITTGDLDTPERFLNRYQVILSTAEKVDSLLRSRAKWLIDSLSVVVLDEIHFINDGSRGPTLEILTARIKQLNPKAQILALSATVKNADEIAEWLGADLVHSQWRPIPLKEGVYYNGQISFQTGGLRLVREEPPDDLSKLTLDTLRGKGQVLVFVNSRRSAQAAGRQVCPYVSSVLTVEEKRELLSLSKEAVGSSNDATKLCRKLGDVLKFGVAFHHAGLKPRQRKLIEENFKKNIIKVICSTPTLAAGVNLPARRAIIRDVKRYEDGIGAAYIPTSEYKQCAGRAGRPQYDEYGEAILIAKSASEVRILFERYIDAEPEPVTSKLGEESALRIHILASIAGGYVNDVNATFEFISHTFLAHQKQTGHLIEMIGGIFEFLEREKFIEKNGFKFFATEFGQCTSRLYIDPLTAIILRDGLKSVETGKSFSNVGLLHLLCCCPDTPLLHFNKSDIEEVEIFASNFQEEFIMTDKNLSILEDVMFYLASIKTTMLLTHWIDEEKEETLCDKFNVGPGDVYRHTENAQWLLHASVVLAGLFKMKQLTYVLEDLKSRMKYGIKEELISLTRLKGVGRVRARSLYGKGYKKLSDLKTVSVDELSAVPQIGKTLAKEILDQLSGKIHEEKIKTFAAEMTG